MYCVEIFVKSQLILHFIKHDVNHKNLRPIIYITPWSIKYVLFS